VLAFYIRILAIPRNFQPEHEILLLEIGIDNEVNAAAEIHSPIEFVWPSKKDAYGFTGMWDKEKNFLSVSRLHEVTVPFIGIKSTVEASKFIWDIEYTRLAAQAAGASSAILAPLDMD
tara:strand:+ start:131 stop:484 length:354 start_codon:yes stop_codon:yes gene_type:complete